VSPSSPQLPSVLVIDDHRLFAEAIRSVLEEAGMAVGIATDLNSAVELSNERAIDLLIVDGDMAVTAQQGRDGSIRTSGLAAQSMVLVGPAALAAVVRGDFGKVRGRVRKDASSSDFVHAVQAALGAPRTVVSSGTLNRRTAGDQEGGIAAQRLTTREWDVLELMVEGMSNKTIAERLGVGRTTVNTHVQSVLSKLRVHSRLEAAAFAINHGLVAAEGRDGSYRGSRSP
jgi:two-component system nitrate/nitrite response regulator NarL